MKGESIIHNSDDIYGYMVLTVSELKAELNGRGIATSKRLNKRESLVALLTQTVDEEYDNDDDGDEVIDVNEVEVS